MKVIGLNRELPSVALDPIAIKRAVLNLLTNAVEVCGEGDRVTLGARLQRDDAWLHITVADDGPGIPEDVKEQLFQPFFSTKGNRGTGLGLALVRKVAEEHRGRATVDSRPGDGAQFSILLPLDAEQADTAVM